jgi:phospholipid-binding lipoprotein MlaA
MWADLSGGAARRFLRRGVLVLAASLAMAACATAPDDDPEAVAEFQKLNDPIEPTNRAIFEFNLGLDRFVLKPVTGAYRAVFPQPVRDGVHNFLQNLRAPVIFANDLLQGEPGRAVTTFGRFIVNSTLGVAGFGDPAESLGMAQHDEDFGQTLAVWGVGEGPYVMLPVFGPSNPRDVTGRIVDFFLDPINWWAFNSDSTAADWVPIARAVITGIDTRDQLWDVLEDLERTSIDYYAAIRSLYRQRRMDEIRNGASGPAPTLTGELDIKDFEIVTAPEQP